MRKTILAAAALAAFLSIGAPAQKADAMPVASPAALGAPDVNPVQKVYWHRAWGWHRAHYWGWRHRHWGWRHAHYWGWRHRYWGWHHRYWGWGWRRHYWGPSYYPVGVYWGAPCCWYRPWWGWHRYWW